MADFENSTSYSMACRGIRVGFFVKGARLPGPVCVVDINTKRNLKPLTRSRTSIHFPNCRRSTEMCLPLRPWSKASVILHLHQRSPSRHSRFLMSPFLSMAVANHFSRRRNRYHYPQPMSQLRHYSLAFWNRPPLLIRFT